MTPFDIYGAYDFLLTFHINYFATLHCFLPRQAFIASYLKSRHPIT